jgi:hypothetical protein
MKRLFSIALMLTLFSASAFAGKKPPTVTISHPVQVGSTLVPAGDYKITWTGSGSSVQATLSQNEKAIVTFSAKAVDGTNYPSVTTSGADGAVILESIQLAHVSLVLDKAPKSGQ